MKWGLPVVAAALVALGCFGGGSTTMSHDELESEMRQLRSLDREQSLVERVLGERHLTRAFTRGHARYLLQTAHEHVQKLAKVTPEPGDESALEQARADAVRLEDRFVALMIMIQ
jgi:hypothetical protein